MLIITLHGQKKRKTVIFSVWPFSRGAFRLDAPKNNYF